MALKPKIKHYDYVKQNMMLLKLDFINLATHFVNSETHLRMYGYKRICMYSRELILYVIVIYVYRWLYLLFKLPEKCNIRCM